MDSLLKSFFFFSVLLLFLTHKICQCFENIKFGSLTVIDILRNQTLLPIKIVTSQILFTTFSSILSTQSDVGDDYEALLFCTTQIAKSCKTSTPLIKSIKIDSQFVRVKLSSDLTSRSTFRFAWTMNGVENCWFKEHLNIHFRSIRCHSRLTFHARKSLNISFQLLKRKPE